MNRREIMKHLGVLPIAGSFLASKSLLGHTPQDPSQLNQGPFSAAPSIYERLGIDTIINCRGTFTILGGSTERPEVLEAIEAASGYFVQYDELAYGIGKRLAELTKADWGMVSAGCAAGLKHVTAACVAGGNPEKLIQIPNLEKLDKTEVIIPRYSRNVYDHAIRNIGITVVMVDSPKEMERAINSKTAMIYVNSGIRSEKGQPLSLEKIVEIAKPHGIPVLLDAAAENLTIPCVHLQRGATVVAYSGGKAICGPQCAGLLLGDKDLLMSAWQASSPHHGPGRDNKVGKEEMLGMLAAVEAWTTRDHEKEWATWISWLEEISKKMEKIQGITTEVRQPQGRSNYAPVLHIKWNPDQLHITGDEVAEEVARNKPRIAIGSSSKEGETSVNITPNQMRPGNARLVADRLFGILSKKRSPRPDKMAAAKVDLTGHWEVSIDFLSSKSTHMFFLEQKGNWIKGIHKSDFSMQEIMGMVVEESVKLRSIYRAPGNHISYWFSGKASKGYMDGSIFLGEYLTAKFTAKRSKYSGEHIPIVIPGGPPLAT